MTERLEERMSKAEQGLAVAQQLATDTLQAAESGFAGINLRLDRMNNTVSGLKAWQIEHMALEEGRKQAWGSLGKYMGFGFAAIAATQAAVGVVLALVMR